MCEVSEIITSVEWILSIVLTVIMLIMMFIFKRISDKTNISTAILRMSLKELEKFKKEIDMNIEYKKIEKTFIKKLKGKLCKN